MPRLSLALAAVTLTLAACGGGAPTSSANTTGSLAVTVNGLPPATNAAITVTGPASYSQSLTATGTLTGLAAGTYTVTGDQVTSGVNAYSANPPSQAVLVGAGNQASATVAYAQSNGACFGENQATVPAPPGAGTNLDILGAYIVQTIEDPARSISLVQGKRAYIRVFAHAADPNTLQPTVRVRLYQNGALAGTCIAPATGLTVPTSSTINESSFNTSWNVPVPAQFVQPGLSFLVDVDPSNVITESNEADNSYPANGTPVTVNVKAVPAYSVLFIPVTIPKTGLTGDVTAANVANYVSMFKKIWPVASVTATVRATPMTWSDTATVLQDAASWTSVLSQVYAIRQATPSANANYFGVVGTTYSSGIAGIGYVGAPAALGWDKSGSRAGVAAHELGHNFGREHAPCGNPDPSSIDSAYPGANGVTGIWGFDVQLADSVGFAAPSSSNIIKPPTFTDIMGYCNNQWMSAYHYNKVLTSTALPAVVTASQGVVQPALIVWGRYTRTGAVLEPAFEALTTPSLPSGRGAWTIEGFDAQNRVVYSAAFDGIAVDHDPNAARTFAFAIPLTEARRQQLVGFRLRGPAGLAEVRATTAGAATPTGGSRAIKVNTPPGGRAGVAVQWDAATYPLAVVRDAATGDILSLAHGGSVVVNPSAGRVTVDLSDGIRTVRANAP